MTKWLLIALVGAVLGVGGTVLAVSLHHSPKCVHGGAIYNTC